jgi:hypothetical protein
MEIEVRVRLIDLKRAFRRLLARLPDESEASGDFIVFSASGNRLGIVVGGTSEDLSASVVHPGQARVPSPVFRGVARSLRFYRAGLLRLLFRRGCSESFGPNSAIPTFPSRSTSVRSSRTDKSASLFVAVLLRILQDFA